MTSNAQRPQPQPDSSPGVPGPSSTPTWRIGRQRSGGIEIQPRPLRSRQGPLVLATLLDSAVPRVDAEPHVGLAIPAICVALQEIVEESALQLASLGELELLLVVAPVDFQPLLVRSSADEGFEVAALVQAKSGPVGGRQKR